MHRAAGFRAEANQFWWAIVQGTNGAAVLVEQGKAAAPAGSDEPSGLSALRDRALLLIKTHTPTRAAVRTAEPIAKVNGDGARRRLRVEGVLLQALHSCGVEVLACGLATVGARLAIGTAKAKTYLEGTEVRGIDISKLPTAAREAILVAVAALPPTGGN